MVSVAAKADQSAPPKQFDRPCEDDHVYALVVAASHLDQWSSEGMTPKHSG